MWNTVEKKKNDSLPWIVYNLLHKSVIQYNFKKLAKVFTLVWACFCLCCLYIDTKPLTSVDLLLIYSSAPVKEHIVPNVCLDELGYSMSVSWATAQRLE